MPRTEALDRAIKKYETDKVERIVFRVQKGRKDELQQYASKRGESLSGFINRAINETIARDSDQKTNQ